MSIPPKAIYRSNVIPIKIPMVFFQRNRTNNPKTSVKPQNSLNSQRNLEMNYKAGGIMLPDFKLYNKAIVMEIILAQKQTDR